MNALNSGKTGLAALAVILTISSGAIAQDDAELCGTTELIAASNDRALSSYDLMGFTPDDLTLARNEIFARHGYVFLANQAAADWFASCEWYQPSGDGSQNKNISLTAIEAANVKAIQKVETSREWSNSALLLIPSAKTAYTATWVAGEDKALFDVLYADGKLRRDPIYKPDEKTTVKTDHHGVQHIPRLIQLFDFGAGTYSLSELNDFDVTDQVLHFSPDLTFGVRLPSGDYPYLPFPGNWAGVQVLDQAVINYGDETDVTRFTIESKQGKWDESSLKGDVWVTKDGIMIAARLSGKKPEYGEMDTYIDWAVDYHLENLTRLETYNADSLKMPTLLEGKQWNAPG